MTGPEHYQAAEKDIEAANNATTGTGRGQFLITRAQVHANLALAAAIHHAATKVAADGDH